MVSIQLPLKNYRDFIARDIARISLKGHVLKIDTYLPLLWFCWWGIAWEILALEPKLSKILFSSQIGATDWLIANCYLQEQIPNILKTH
jgi:hypothetical protein